MNTMRLGLARPYASRNANADTYFKMGAGLFAAGRFHEAETSFRQALQSKPAFADAHNHLGFVLLNTKRFADAEASFLRALSIDLGLVSAFSGLGQLLRVTGRHREAEGCFRRALELTPNDELVYNDIGAVINELGRFDEAESLFRQALKIRPGFAEAHYNLGVTLLNQRRPAAASASFSQALVFEPRHARALVGLGAIEANAGHFTQAEAWYRRAIEAEQEMPEAWSALVSLRKMTLEDTEWLENASRIVKRDLRPRQEIAMRFALGKYFDDIEKFDLAFQHFSLAHALKKSVGKPYDRVIRSEAVDSLIAGFPRQRVQKVRATASLSTVPLFVVGLPRSGTSLVEQIVASHKAVHGAGELLFWDKAVSRLWQVAVENEASDETLVELAQGYLGALRQHSSESTRVIDKMPGNFGHLGLIHSVFPNARILHVQRNPVDTCLSIYFQNFNRDPPYANDLHDLAHFFRQYHRLMAHWREVLPPEVFLDVPYEGLLEDQEGWTRRIMDFVGLEWDDQCLNFQTTERDVNTASKWQVRQKIYTSSRDRWRNYESFVGPLLPLLELS
ncbi:MAG: sulfotransferase [Rhodocyclaceae bacterium]|nr:sulfotransferase [Rhodocyclaceae bacterium]